MKCDHYERTVEWIEEEHYLTGEMEDRLIEEWVSLFVDVDLYRFKCKQCGEIQYYSGNRK